MKKVYLTNITADLDNIKAAFEASYQYLGLKISPGDRLVIKPNLTCDYYVPGLVVSPQVTEGFIQFLCDHGAKVLFVEGDGGNYAYSMEKAYTNLGYAGYRQRYGIQYANVCVLPKKDFETQVAGRTVKLPAPAFLQEHDYDKFISFAVFKTHVHTKVTLGYKNLWGLIPDTMRMYYHKFLDWGIVGLAKVLKPDWTIIDGFISLDREGPINGVPVQTNRILVANDSGAGEDTACRVMKINPDSVRHLRFAKQEGLIPALSEIETNVPVSEFQTHQFQVERPFFARLSWRLAQFPELQKLVYQSPVSPFIYSIVNSLRKGHMQVGQRNRSYDDIVQRQPEAVTLWE